MHEREKRKVIEAHKAEIAGYLNELDEADDVDLWEEAAAKLCDVLLVYRRIASDPAMAGISDEQLAELAFRSAVEGFMLSRGSVGCVVREDPE